MTEMIEVRFDKCVTIPQERGHNAIHVDCDCVLCKEVRAKEAQTTPDGLVTAVRRHIAGREISHDQFALLVRMLLTRTRL